MPFWQSDHHHHHHYSHHLWQCFSPAGIFACYFATLSSLETREAQTMQMIFRLAVAASATLLLAVPVPTTIIHPSILKNRWWHLLASTIQFTSACGLFLLICQRPPSSARGKPNYYYFSLLSLTEHAYTLPLLGLCRIAPSQLLFMDKFRHAFDSIIGWILGPLCTALLFALPQQGLLSSSSPTDLSTPADLSRWQPWLLFLLLAAVHLVAAEEEEEGAGAASSAVAEEKGRRSSDDEHEVQTHKSTWEALGTITRGAVLCVGIACFYVRRLLASADKNADETLIASDFYFFRSFASRVANGNSAGQYVLQGTMLVWLGLLASRWFEEITMCIFFNRCSACAKRNITAVVASPAAAAKQCMRCYSMHVMKDDVDDACAAMAVAGILLGAFSISSRPLPETHAADMVEEHSFTMLAALGTLAAVVTGVMAVHFMVRMMLTAVTGRKEDGKGLTKQHSL